MSNTAPRVLLIEATLFDAVDTDEINDQEITEAVHAFADYDGVGSLFDTVTHEWVSAPTEAPVGEIPTKDSHGRQILTVGALRQLLANVADDIHVVCDDGEGWFWNVEAVGIPEPDHFETGEGDYACFTFMKGEGFDSRQF